MILTYFICSIVALMICYSSFYVTGARLIACTILGPLMIAAGVLWCAGIVGRIIFLSLVDEKISGSL